MLFVCLAGLLMEHSVKLGPPMLTVVPEVTGPGEPKLFYKGGIHSFMILKIFKENIFFLKL
jgi:hypothetical protein